MPKNNHMYNANWLIDEMMMEIYEADCQVDFQLSYGKSGNGFSATWQLRKNLGQRASTVKASGETYCLPTIKAVMNMVIGEAWPYV